MDYASALPSHYKYLAELRDTRQLSGQDIERVNEALKKDPLPMEQANRVREWLETKPKIQPDPKPKVVPPAAAQESPSLKDLIELGQIHAIPSDIETEFGTFKPVAATKWDSKDSNPLEDIKTWMGKMKGKEGMFKIPSTGDASHPASGGYHTSPKAYDIYKSASKVHPWTESMYEYKYHEANNYFAQAEYHLDEFYNQKPMLDPWIDDEYIKYKKYKQMLMYGYIPPKDDGFINITSI